MRSWSSSGQKSKEKQGMSRDLKTKRLLIHMEREKRACEREFYEFVKRAWHIVEPKTPFIDNWHFFYLCNLLQEEIERIVACRPKTKDIIINIPPRSSKSTIVSVMLTPWAWINYPHLRFINSSHTDELSTFHCVQSRTIIDSQWYQGHWGNRFKMSTDQNVKTFFVNDARGHRIATSVGASNITGQGCDVLIADDLIDPKKATSQTAIKNANDHWDHTLFNRLNNFETGLRVIVQQRTAKNDTTGHVLETDKDNYRHICITGELSDKTSLEVSGFYQDGLFWPPRFPMKVLDGLRRTLGTLQYSSQVQQNPLNVEGGTIKYSWFKFYKTAPRKFDRMLASWDMSFEEGDMNPKKNKNSFVVCQVWGKIGQDAYLIWQLRKRMGFVDTLKAFNMVSEQFPHVLRKLVERKANGHGIYDVVKSKIPGVKPVNPKDVGGKEERLVMVSPLIESGFVYLPDPEIYKWVADEYLPELTGFPNYDTNDQVDATSQALSDLYNLSDNMYRDLLEMKE